VRLVVPYPPGGPTDTASRIIGQKLSEALGQPVVIDNRPGASGTIGAESVARSAPDGYTLLVMTNPTLLAPHLTHRKSYDLFKDFTPVASAYDLPIVMVVNPKAMPDVTTLPQYIAYAKAHPGANNYTSASNGSFGHISTELLKSLGHFDAQHVPYKGSAPAMADVLAGQVPMMFSDMIAASARGGFGAARQLCAGCEDDRGTGLPGFRCDIVGGHRGARRHATGDRREAHRRPETRAGRPRRAGEAAGRRNIGGLHAARTVRCADAG
jgi:tripartite-type tricarboxylate transporter receptor subunit TctC